MSYLIWIIIAIVLICLLLDYILIFFACMGAFMLIAFLVKKVKNKNEKREIEKKVAVQAQCYTQTTPQQHPNNTTNTPIASNKEAHSLPSHIPPHSTANSNDSKLVHVNTHPTAQNAYIFNIDYIKSCQAEFVAFDLETTGLSPSIDRIIEISAVRYQNFKPCDSFSTLVDPGRHIPKSASEVNHITDEDVINAPAEGKAIHMFCDFIGENALNGEVVLVAHNALFDIKFLLYALSRSGIEANTQFQDTLYMGRSFSLGLPNYKLETLAGHYEIIQNNVHRALDDAYTCGEIFIRLLQYKHEQHIEKHEQLTPQEIELCVWLKELLEDNDLNTQLLTFCSKTYLQFKCFGEVARFKTRAKKPYALIPKNISIPESLEVVAPSKAESEKYLRVYFSSPQDLSLLKQYYIDAYKKAHSRAESYISDSVKTMRTVAQQIDGDICI